MIKDVQDFIEKYYPNYSSSDEIAHLNDLENARDSNYDESDPEDSAWKLIRDEYDSDPESMILELDYAEKCIEVLKDAILGFIEQSKPINAPSITEPGKCPDCGSENYSPVEPDHPFDKCNDCGRVWHDR